MKKLISLLLLAFGYASAQNITAALQPVSTDGMYKIAIPHEIRSLSKSDLADFRIYDRQKREVPYSILGVYPQVIYQTAQADFRDFPIISRSSVPNKSTSIVAQNVLPEIRDISIKVTLTEITKNFSISGSNDQRLWYGIKDRQAFFYNMEVETAGYSTINLPPTRYRYLRLDFDDKKSLPINIERVGHYEPRPNQYPPVLDTLKGAQIEITELRESKKTRIKVSFASIQFIEKIVIPIKSPAYYNRNGRIYISMPLREKRRTRTVEHDLGLIKVSSKLGGVEKDFDIHDKEFFIEIDNRDNPPLEIGQIYFMQYRTNIVASLRKNEQYTVTSGEASRDLPDYDVPHFIASQDVPAGLPETVITYSPHKVDKPGLTANRSFWQKSWFLWACIVISAGVVGWFAYALVRDMKA